MSQITDLLSGALRGQLGAISQQIGTTPEQTTAALNAALPALLGGLARNTQQPGGAESLASALDRDHDGSLIDGIGGLLGGAGSNTGVGGLLQMAGAMLGAAPGPGGAKSTDAQGILGHILGNKQGAIEQGMAKAAGIDKKKAGLILLLLAPLIMSVLGKIKRNGGLSAGGIGDLIRGTTDKAAPAPSQGGGGGILGGLLDKDDDGSIADDLAKMAGRQIFGNLFR